MCPIKVKAQSSWSSVLFRIFRKLWMLGGGVLGMFNPSEAHADSMTCCAVSGRLSMTFVSLSDFFCDMITGQRASVFYSHAVTFLSTPVSPEWSCGAAGGRGG